MRVMRREWDLFGTHPDACGGGGGRMAPTFIVSLLGSARVNDIRPRYKLQYFQTVLRMVEFIENMRTLYALPLNSRTRTSYRSSMLSTCLLGLHEGLVMIVITKNLTGPSSTNSDRILYSFGKKIS